MRPLLAMLVLATGCIAAEPGKGKDTDASPRKACTTLEGLSFQNVDNVLTVGFIPDDAEYSTYTETAADGTQSLGLAQCIDTGSTIIIYTDGATEHWSARADIPNTSGGMFLQWTDGSFLISPVVPNR